MDVFLQAQTVLLLFTMLPPVHQEEHCEYYYIYKVCQRCPIPWGMDCHGKMALGCRDTVLLCYYAEIVAAWRQMAEGNFVDPRLHANPFFVIDAIAVGDVFWVIIGQRRELDGKSVVTRAQHETVRGDDCRVGDSPKA